MIPEARLLSGKTPRGYGKLDYRGKEVSGFRSSEGLLEYLAGVLGEPTRGRSIDGKVTAEWVYSLPDGSTFSVYDYKGWVSSGGDSKSHYSRLMQDRLVSILRDHLQKYGQWEKYSYSGPPRKGGISSFEFPGGKVLLLHTEGGVRHLKGEPVEILGEAFYEMEGPDASGLEEHRD